MPFGEKAKGSYLQACFGEAMTPDPTKKEIKPFQEKLNDYVERLRHSGNACSGCDMGDAGPGPEGEHDPDCFYLEAQVEFSRLTSLLEEKERERDVALKEMCKVARELGLTMSRLKAAEEREKALVEIAEKYHLEHQKEFHRRDTPTTGTYCVICKTISESRMAALIRGEK
jgi:hypothetical protein